MFIEHSLLDPKGPRCVSRVPCSQEAPRLPPPPPPLPGWTRDSLLNRQRNSESSGLSYPKVAHVRGLAVDPTGDGFFAVTE